MDCPQVLIGARGYNTRERELNGIREAATLTGCRDLTIVESFTSSLPGNGSAWLLERLISILVEVVLFPKGGFGLLVLMSKVGLPARTEANMPAPETP